MNNEKNDEGIMSFGDKIKAILKNNGFEYKVKVYPCVDKILKNDKRYIQEYDKVVIYSGRHIVKYAQKRSKRLIAWKDVNGEWEGDLNALKEFGDYTGDALYEMGYNDTTEQDKRVLHSDTWEKGEKVFGKGSQEKKLLEILKIWQSLEEGGKGNG